MSDNPSTPPPPAPRRRLVRLASITTGLAVLIAALIAAMVLMWPLGDGARDTSSAPSSTFEVAGEQEEEEPAQQEELKAQAEAPEIEPQPVAPEEALASARAEASRRVDEAHTVAAAGLPVVDDWEEAPAPLVGQRSQRSRLKFALLEIVTDFTKADVQVNGRPYPEYTELPKDRGMVLPAGGPHQILVTYNGQTKHYELHLRPNETRLLIVELSGFRSGAGAPAARPQPPAVTKNEEKEEEKAESGDIGRITVYSKPKADIQIDGTAAGKQTPETVEVEPGRHEVQVKYPDNKLSEKKVVRVRKGSRIKLFFRQK